MNGAKRIQRKRKGWKMPANAVYVGRPTKWGNPFTLHDWRASFRAIALGEDGSKQGCLNAAVKLYKAWLVGKETKKKPDTNNFWVAEVMTISVDRNRPSLKEIKKELRGKDLACWCPLDKPCHADVLLELANS